MRNNKTVLATATAFALALLLLVPSGAGTTVLPYVTFGNTSFEWTGAEWVTNPNGPYENQECGGIDAVLPTPLLLSTEVSFTHEYNIEGFWDGGILLASGDGGLTWTYLNLADYNQAGFSSLPTTCFNDITGGGISYRGFSNIGGGTVTFDLADHGFATGDLVQVRFVFATDFSVTRAGWTISDLTVGGVPQWIL